MIGLLILLLVAGVVLWIVPMDAGIKRIIVGVIALLVVLWILSFFGLFGDLGLHRWGRRW